jgi:hypothetical protein
MNHAIAKSYTRPGILRRPNVTDWLTFVMALGFTLGALGLAARFIQQPLIALAPFVAVAIVVPLWRFPTLSLFALFASSTLIEGLSQHFPDSLTDRIPLWRPLSMSGGGIPISPAEMLMIGGIAIWFLRGIFSQTLETHTSSLFSTYRWYTFVVLAGALHGVATGGDYHTVLWEVRAQFYGLMILFLAINLLRSRRQFDNLGWIIILGTGFKGIQGFWRYFVTFHGSFSGNELLEHEEALFFPAFYMFLILLSVFGGSRRQKRVALALLPFVIIADFANNRRASTGAFVFSLIAVTFTLFTVMVRRRKQIMRAGLVALAIFGLYAGAFWGSNSTFAKPLRAINSQISPDERDEGSDLYRELEIESIMIEIRQNLIVGRGYGTEMQLLPGMVDVRSSSPFMLVMPHNSILWVWWRTGLIGFVLFWMAWGTAIIRNCFLARSTEDRYLQRWAIFAVAVTIIFVLIGWWDQGLFSPRLVVYTWTVLAVPEVLRRSIPAANTSLTTMEPTHD